MNGHTYFSSARTYLFDFKMLKKIVFFVNYARIHEIHRLVRLLNVIIIQV